MFVYMYPCACGHALTNMRPIGRPNHHPNPSKVDGAIFHSNCARAKSIVAFAPSCPTSSGITCLQASGFFHRHILSSDPKPAAIRLMKVNTHAEHNFSECKFGTIRRGKCHFHCQRDLCTIDDDLKEDIFVAGFNCAPFSTMRRERKRVTWRDHPESESFFQVMDHIRRRRPRIVILENVIAFTYQQPGETSAFDILNDFFEEIGGYGPRSLTTGSKPWIEGERNRCCSYLSYI